MTKAKVTICPYCGETQPADEQCRNCGGFFEPLSRQATHNGMGPWFIRDPQRAFQPGCSYETLVRLIQRAKVTKYTILRGPTTKQFWTVAKHVPGVAHLLGYCHNCDASVDPGDHGCHACGVAFGAYLDRNFLGLPEIRAMPWDPEMDHAAGGQEGIGQALEWQRPGRASGLSSFASDEELLGYSAGGSAAGGVTTDSSGAATAPGTVAATETAPPRPQPQPQPRLEIEGPEHGLEREGRPAGAGAVSTVATRAMQRRIAQQHRTIRALTLLLVLSITAAAVVVVAGFFQPPEPETAAIEPKLELAPPVIDVSAGQPASAAEAPIETADDAVHPEDPMPETDAAPSAHSGDATAAQEPSADEPADDYQLALQLESVARDETKSVKERIQALEQASAILHALPDRADQTREAAELAASIERVDSSLERLRLKEFFP